MSAALPITFCQCWLYGFCLEHRSAVLFFASACKSKLSFAAACHSFRNNRHATFAYLGGVISNASGCEWMSHDLLAHYSAINSLLKSLPPAAGRDQNTTANSSDTKQAFRPLSTDTAARAYAVCCRPAGVMSMDRVIIKRALQCSAMHLQQVS